MFGFPKGPPLRTQAPGGPLGPLGRAPPGGEGGLLIKDLLISGKVKTPGPPPEKGSPPRFLVVLGGRGGSGRGEARWGPAGGPLEIPAFLSLLPTLNYNNFLSILLFFCTAAPVAAQRLAN